MLSATIKCPHHIFINLPRRGTLLFSKFFLRTLGGEVVKAFLVTKATNEANANLEVLEAEGEGGSALGPPHCDKGRASKFKLCSSLQEYD